MLLTVDVNPYCERVIGTLRRECLDFMIPLNERHLYRILKQWVAYYNASRPHMSLGPGIPQPPRALPEPRREQRHGLPPNQPVQARPILSGLHHDYWLEKRAA
jgi:transposase InsO family protein